MVTPEEAKRICPQLDLSGGGRYPVLGASHHVGAATARHDRVVWAYAQGAMRRGRARPAEHAGHRPAAGRRPGHRRRTPNGAISAGVVLSAVGGNVTTHRATMPDVRLPIRTHPLQAFVTNGYAQGFGPIVSDTELFCYVSQTARGQMLIGAEFDPQPSYSKQSSFNFLQSCASKVSHLLPFLTNLRILRQWTGICDVSADFSPIMGVTGVDGFLHHHRAGARGASRRSPPAGEQLAELIATGTTPAAASHPFGLDRFARDHGMADPGSTGTR